MAELFWWLRTCVAMADSFSSFFGDLSAAVAARTLSVAVCGLLPAEAGNADTILKAQLHTLRDRSFPWPPVESVRPKALPALPKNIAKNFVETFFCEKGHGLVL